MANVPQAVMEILVILYVGTQWMMTSVDDGNFDPTLQRRAGMWPLESTMSTMSVHHPTSAVRSTLAWLIPHITTLTEPVPGAYPISEAVSGDPGVALRAVPASNVP